MIRNNKYVQNILKQENSAFINSIYDIEDSMHDFKLDFINRITKKKILKIYYYSLDN